ncbi:MAG TPA: glucose-6-phosphate isomerase [Campylobacterales bacterium]|nr:glucose-6-phosphate isomerase [Campylobacterales bacterium]
MENRLYFDRLEGYKADKQALLSTINREHETIGYYTLPDQEIDEILAYSESFGDEIEDVVVLGIGGSSLGAKAIYEFLKPLQPPKRRLFFFESTDPLNIAAQLKEINIDKSHFLVISKSGGTVETLAIFKYIFAPNPTPNAYTFITDEGSNLDKFAADLGAKRFYLPPNVGGRFSVLSVVGLIPLALCGIDVKGLLSGAKEVKNSFFEEGVLKYALLDKAFFYARHHQTYNINCIFAYSETLKYFTEWYVQLWGESLGKRQRHSSFNVGLTPIGLIGPKDQHSFLQLIMEGNRDKSVTFIKLREFEHELYIPSVTLKHLEALDMLNDVPFHDLINMQCDSVMQALKNEKEIPLDEIIIPAVNAKSIGGLMFYYELLTSMVGELLDVNTYDQPGVEAGKIILKEKLKSLDFSLA